MTLGAIYIVAVAVSLLLLPSLLLLLILLQQMIRKNVLHKTNRREEISKGMNEFKSQCVSPFLFFDTPQ